MRVVAFGQQKGGVGKSAAAINLACQAIEAGESAVIIDMDWHQGTAFQWGQRRGGKAPAVLSADSNTLNDVLAKVSAKDWVILDLPGRNAPVSGAGIMAANLVLVPCRPLDVDVEASAPTVHICQRGGKRYAYMMSIAVSQHDKRRARLVAKVLADAGQPVCPVIIASRMAVPDAIVAGKGVNEAFPGSESATEFRELFQWVRRTVR